MPALYQCLWMIQVGNQWPDFFFWSLNFKIKFIDQTKAFESWHKHNTVYKTEN